MNLCSMFNWVPCHENMESGYTCDFFLFSRLKKVLKGHRFEATEDIKRNSTKTLLDIPKEEFAKCFQQWQQFWAKCVAAEGKYVEDN